MSKDWTSATQRIETRMSPEGHGFTISADGETVEITVIAPQKSRKRTVTIPREMFLEALDATVFVADKGSGE